MNYTMFLEVHDVRLALEGLVCLFVCLLDFITMKNTSVQGDFWGIAGRDP